jgi:hypothetical protein
VRVLLKTPVDAIENFDTEESSVNVQIADILETFDYKRIPNGSPVYDVRAHDFKQLTITMPKIANDRLAKYCKLTGKTRTVVLAQVLMVLGKYKV